MTLCGHTRTWGKPGLTELCEKQKTDGFVLGLRTQPRPLAQWYCVCYGISSPEYKFTSVSRRETEHTSIRFCTQDECGGAGDLGAVSMPSTPDYTTSPAL